MSDSQYQSASDVAYISPGNEAPASPLAHAASLQGAPLDGSWARGLRRASFWVILLLVLSYTFLDYWGYSAEYRAHPELYETFAQGQGSAPAQYRIGLIYAAKILHKVGHLGYRHSFALFDLVFALAATLLVRNVLLHLPAFGAATQGSRWTQMAMLLGLLSFYFSWSLWYQRPETWASAFFVAGSVYLLSVVGSQVALSVGLLVLAAFQGFVRADVAILFHFGLFLYLLLRGAEGFRGSRGLLLVTSLVCTVLPTGILWVLMHQVFPHATYGDTKVFQAVYNLNPWNSFPFLLFIVPTLYACRRAVPRFNALSGPQAALLVSSVIYVCSWFMVGRLAEVRIFVPFALALGPVATSLAGEAISAASA